MGRTDVFLLEFAGEVALDKGRLAGTAIANKHKLEAKKEGKR